jgi:hypothetical protein
VQLLRAGEHQSQDLTKSSGVDAAALRKARYVEGYHRAPPDTKGTAGCENTEDMDKDVIEQKTGTIQEKPQLLLEGEHTMDGGQGQARPKAVDA